MARRHDCTTRSSEKSPMLKATMSRRTHGCSLWSTPRWVTPESLPGKRSTPAETTSGVRSSAFASTAWNSDRWAPAATRSIVRPIRSGFHSVRPRQMRKQPAASLPRRTSPHPSRRTPLGMPHLAQPPSNRSAASTTILRYAPDNLAAGLSFVSDELNGINRDNTGTVRPRSPRTYSGGLWQMIKENSRSRVFLGLHWIFDGFAVDANGDIDLSRNVGGVPLGLSIADDIATNGLDESQRA